MKCVLCEKKIENYSQKFNRFVINDSKTADICMGCIHRLLIWQQEIITKLFPTKVAKKWLEQKKETVNL